MRSLRFSEIDDALSIAKGKCVDDSIASLRSKAGTTDEEVTLFRQTIEATILLYYSYAIVEIRRMANANGGEA